MENKKLNLDDEVFEGLADLLVAIGAECRRRGAKLPGKRDPDQEACEYFVDGRADDDRENEFTN